MGRAHNSFVSWVGHAAETVTDDKGAFPEKDLWIAVLCRAVLDACKGPPMLNLDLKSNRSHQNIYTYDRDQARHFFMEGGSHFRLICEMAGRDPDYVQEKVRSVILRKNGWNVDVPITSHYRQGPKRKRGPYKKLGRPRKNPVPRKNPMIVARGSKGGRPRMYYV